MGPKVERIKKQKKYPEAKILEKDLGHGGRETNKKSLRKRQEKTTAGWFVVKGNKGDPGGSWPGGGVVESRHRRFLGRMGGHGGKGDGGKRGQIMEKRV